MDYLINEPPNRDAFSLCCKGRKKIVEIKEEPYEGESRFSHHQSGSSLGIIYVDDSRCPFLSLCAL